MVLRILCLLGTCVCFSFGVVLDMDSQLVQEQITPMFNSLLTLSIMRSAEGDSDWLASHGESSDVHSTDKPNAESTTNTDFKEHEVVPKTSFDCSDKPYIPGLYADVETGCKVFHICWPRMRESFVCGPGKTFNHTSEFCDFWYYNTCSESNDSKNELYVEYYKNIHHVIRDEEPTSYGAIYDALAARVEVLYQRLRNQAPQFREFPLTANERYYRDLRNVNLARTFLPITRTITVHDPIISVRKKQSAQPRVGKMNDSRYSEDLSPEEVDIIFVDVLTQLAEVIREYILRNDISNIELPLVVLLLNVAKLVIFLYSMAL